GPAHAQGNRWFLPRVHQLERLQTIADGSRAPHDLVHLRLGQVHLRNDGVKPLGPAMEVVKTDDHAGALAALDARVADGSIRFELEIDVAGMLGAGISEELEALVFRQFALAAFPGRAAGD